MTEAGKEKTKKKSRKINSKKEKKKKNQNLLDMSTPDSPVPISMWKMSLHCSFKYRQEVHIIRKRGADFRRQTRRGFASIENEVEKMNSLKSNWFFVILHVAQSNDSI